MKIETLLDYQTVLANCAQPVHLALRFTAPVVETGRASPIAFCLVLDRSGSMQGRPLDAAKEAASLVIRNLRKDDRIALVAFDSDARVVIPLQSAANRAALLQAVDSIHPGGSTNLTGGWMLGRDELKKAEPGLPRRLLLLTDGHLNVGIVAPEAVQQVVSAGLERERIATSCLGFGDGYHEDLLAALSGATNGHFYDANSADQLPVIFAAELDGLQAIAAQNLRVRLRRLEFCEAIEVLSDYPVVTGPDGVLEIAVGSLISEEERTLVVALEVLPIPLVTGGKPAADLAGERLIEVEALYDLLQPDAVTSHQWRQTVRVLAVQDQKEVRLNAEVVGIVSTQQTGKTLGDAIAEADRGQVDEAKARLLAAILRLKGYPPSTATAEALRVLEDYLAGLETAGEFSVRERKAARYRSQFYRKMSSAQHWSSEEAAPSFNRPRRPRQADNDPTAGETRET